MKKNNKTDYVIFILADDMGFGDLSYFNQYLTRITPNLDKLISGMGRGNMAVRSQNWRYIRYDDKVPENPTPDKLKSIYSNKVT